MPDGGILQPVALGVDAIDPLAQARFWAAALGWEVGDDLGGVADLVPTDGTRFGLRFLPSKGEKVGPNRLHLDLTTGSAADQEETVARLLDAGGRHLDVGQGPDERHVVLADPEGNELCIIEPENRFLGDCPRLGSITCDGSQAVGRFWSEALGWPLVWDQDEETAVRAPDGRGPMITWGGPPVAPKRGRDRLHLDLAPTAGIEPDAAMDHLLALGATRTGLNLGRDGEVAMADPDGTDFRLLAPWHPVPSPALG